MSYGTMSVKLVVIIHLVALLRAEQSPFSNYVIYNQDTNDTISIETLENQAKQKQDLTMDQAPEEQGVRIGDVCNIKALPIAGHEADTYFQCVKPTKDDVAWPWPHLGQWEKAYCPPGRLFSPKDHKCRTDRHVRRQQARFCNQNPQVCQQAQIVVQPQRPACGTQGCQPQQIVLPQQPITCQTPPCQQPIGCQTPPCQQPCQTPNCRQPYQPPIITPIPYIVTPDPRPRPCPLVGPTTSGQAGGICSWMFPRLATDPTSVFYFLQCAPASPGLYCGRWRKMPCAPGTQFDVNVQVCVHTENPGTLPPYQPTIPYVVPVRPVQPIINPCSGGSNYITNCNTNSQCPGFSTCQAPMNSCCQQTYGK